MNKIDFTNLGGFPLEEDTLNFLQDSYTDMFASFANLVGNKVILSGVQVVGGNVTNGWITYNGEVLKFIGGAAGAGVVIVETTSDATFEDQSIRPVYKTRYATIGAPATFPFTDLKPVNLGVPAGTVVMWSGSVNAIPAGWQLHAPLAGKFIVGYDPADPDYNAIGKSGGNKQTFFDWTNLPAQASGAVLPGEYGMIQRSVPGAVNTIQNADSNGSGTEPNLISPPQKLDLGGAGIPLDRRAPFYTLAYIVKL